MATTGMNTTVVLAALLAPPTLWTLFLAARHFARPALVLAVTLLSAAVVVERVLVEIRGWHDVDAAWRGATVGFAAAYALGLVTPREVVR